MAREQRENGDAKMPKMSLLVMNMAFATPSQTHRPHIGSDAGLQLGPHPSAGLRQRRTNIYN